MRNKSYSTISFIIFCLLSCNSFNRSNLTKGYKLENAPTNNTDILSKISYISDNELVNIAKRINEDSLPGESTLAEIVLTEALRKNPKNTEALFEYSKLTEKQKLHPTEKVKKSFGFIYQAFLIDPNDPKIRYKLANLFFELEKPDLFQGLYENTLTQYPNHIETKIEKMKVLAQSDPKVVVKLSKEVLDSGGRIEDFLPQFLYALKASDEKKKFAHNLHAFAKKYSDRWLWYHLGLEYTANKQYSRAEHAFEKSITLGNDIIGGLQVAQIQYRNQNKAKLALGNLNKVLKKIDSNTYLDSSVKYFVHTQIACAMLYSKHTNKNKLKKELQYLGEHAYQNSKYFQMTINEFLQKGYENTVLNSLNLAIKQDPLFLYPYQVLEKIYTNQKKYTLAKSIHKKISILQSSTTLLSKTKK